MATFPSYAQPLPAADQAQSVGPAQAAVAPLPAYAHATPAPGAPQSVAAAQAAVAKPTGLPDLASITGGQPGPNPFTIGGMVLNSIDCPTELAIGTGEQKMVVTETIGGGKVVHVTGFQPDANTWTGKFHQPGIVGNVAQMRSFMVDGQERKFTWKGEEYYGIVKTFKPTYRRGGNECDWSLSVEVTRAANGAFSVTSPLPAADDAIAAQFQTINGGNATIQSVYGPSTLGSASSATEFDTPAQTAAGTFGTSLTAAQAAVTTATPTAVASAADLSAASSAVAATQATVPPMLATMPSGTAPYLAAEQIGTALAVVRATLSTVQTQSVKQVQGGSLFALAATKYGDVSQAYAIMAANRLITPTLPGSTITNVVLPPLPGVFNNGKTISSLGFGA